MTIGGIIGVVILSVIIITVAIRIIALFDWHEPWKRILVAVVAIGVIIGLFFGVRWYFQNTASGQRAITDQKSELNNGLERVITVYTADGKVIAQYEGQIDIEGNDGGYVVFDYEGRRYTYYNCFVESVAEIK